MSDLSYFDLLYLKGDLDLAGYTYITVAGPIIFFIVVIGWWAIHDYGPDIRYKMKKILRRRK